MILYRVIKEHLLRKYFIKVWGEMIVFSRGRAFKACEKESLWGGSNLSINKGFQGVGEREGVVYKVKRNNAGT